MHRCGADRPWPGRSRLPLLLDLLLELVAADGAALLGGFLAFTDLIQHIEAVHDLFHVRIIGQIVDGVQGFLLEGLHHKDLLKGLSPKARQTSPGLLSLSAIQRLKPARVGCGEERTASIERAKGGKEPKIWHSAHFHDIAILQLSPGPVPKSFSKDKARHLSCLQ